MDFRKYALITKYYFKRKAAPNASVTNKMPPYDFENYNLY